MLGWPECDGAAAVQPCLGGVDNLYCNIYIRKVKKTCSICLTFYAKVMILYNTFLTIGPEPKKANINLFMTGFVTKMTNKIQETGHMFISSKWSSRCQCCRN